MDESGLLDPLRALDVRGLAPARRERLARAWADDALLEHASIAAFSRFALELLAIGAPPALLAATHTAALDEIVHARCAFALASRYAGAPLGPGALVEAATPLAVPDVATMVAAATRDGCLGETAAAVIAARERDACEVPPVRALLAQIAVDEARHAALAWRFVVWAIATHGAAATDAFEAVLAAPPPDDTRVPPGPDLTQGRLGDPARTACAAAVHARVLGARAALCVEPERMLTAWIAAP